MCATVDTSEAAVSVAFEAVDELRGMLSVPAGADPTACEGTGYVTAMRAANAGAYNPW
jgi:hypothetical protein